MAIPSLERPASFQTLTYSPFLVEITDSLT